jgi:hypothetical protein
MKEFLTRAFSSVLWPAIVAALTLASMYGFGKSEISNIKNAVAAQAQHNQIQDQKIETIEVNHAGDHQLLLDIGQDISEIKSDVKDIKKTHK